MGLELRGGVLVDNTPIEKKIASLGQSGLPIGPVLPITGGYSAEDTEAQIAKNSEQSEKLPQTGS